MNDLNTIKFYLHTADMVRASVTKWVSMFNRPQALNPLTQETVP